VVTNPYLCNYRCMRIRWHVGDVIGKMREIKGMTRAELAKKSDLSAYWMGQIEKSGKFKGEKLENIARALGISVSDLYSEVPQPAPLKPQIGLCETNADHRKYQVMLDEIFHKHEEKGEWIRGNVITFHERLFPGSTGDTPPEGQHGPGRPLDDRGPNTPLVRSKKRGA
jgi:transcriptional regulator with XRE-family HTH domain